MVKVFLISSNGANVNVAGIGHRAVSVTDLSQMCKHDDDDGVPLVVVGRRGGRRCGQPSNKVNKTQINYLRFDCKVHENEL